MDQNQTTTEQLDSAAPAVTEQAQASATDPQAADVGTVGEAQGDSTAPAPTSSDEPASVGGEQPLASGVTDADVADEQALREIAIGGAGTASLQLPVVEMPAEAAPRLVIAPTVGRKVHFWPQNGQFHSTPLVLGPQPMDATVVYVHDDRMVNLHVADHIGQVHALSNVILRQPGEDVLEGQPFAEWMPFQVGQARASV